MKSNHGFYIFISDVRLEVCGHLTLQMVNGLHFPAAVEGDPCSMFI